MSSIKRAVIVGAGLMGNGIGQVIATAGLRVTLVDSSEKALSKGMETIRKNLSRVAAKKFQQEDAKAAEWQQSIVANIQTSTKLQDAITQDCDLVIEAIVENLQAKVSLFREIDKLAPQHAILASNTSSISITEIIKGVHGSDTKRIGNWAGLHFFNPVPMYVFILTL